MAVNLGDGGGMREEEEDNTCTRWQGTAVFHSVRVEGPQETEAAIADGDDGSEEESTAGEWQIGAGLVRSLRLKHKMVKQAKKEALRRARQQALATVRQGDAVAAAGDGGHVTDKGDGGEMDESARRCLAATVTVAEASAILHSCLQRWSKRRVVLLQASARLVLRAVARRGLAFAGLLQMRSAGGVLKAFARGAMYQSRYARALFLVLLRRQQSAVYLWAVLRGILARRAYSRDVTSARVLVAFVKRVLARRLTHEKECARVQILASMNRARARGEFRDLHAAGSLLSRAATLAAARLRAARGVAVIQSGLRRVLVQARYGQQLRRKRAVLKIECTVVIQSTFRRALANYQWIIVVQGVRACCARLRSALTCSHRWQSNAAVVLQAGLRASLQRTHAAEVMQLERSARASCTMQACCRRCRHRMQHCQSVAALIIQAAARRRPSAAAFAANCCISCVSKFVTAALCRRNHHARHVASTLLRTYMRSVAMRSRWETMDGAALDKTPAEMRALDNQRQEERCRAIQRMQAASRRWLQSQLGQDIMLQSKRTDLIPCLAALCRRRSARQQHSRLVASTYAQARIRRSTAMEVYRKVLAARIVQAAARRTVDENRKQVAVAAGSRLSLSARRALARSQHISLRLAAVSMSTVLRRGLVLEHERARAQIQAGSRISAALTLQLACRRAISRTAFVRKAAAAWRLGAALRRCAARQGRQRSDDACRGLVRVLRAALLRSNHLAQLLAAKRLRAVLRWKQGQRQGCAMQAQARLAFNIASLQAVCRRTAANASYRRGLSVRSLQAFLRRHYACKGMKEKQFSATMLLTYCMAASASRRCVARHSATKLLQAVFRRCSGQERGSLQMDAMRRGGSAQVLGAFCRRALAREAYCHSLASEMMQAAVRCMLCREAHHRRSQAACILQAATRRTRARHLCCLSAALHGLQAAVRCTRVRWIYRKEVAVRFLQVFVRRVLAQQQRDAVQRSCDMLQRILKAAVAKGFFAEQRAALIRLQAASISREYAAKRQGAMMLQALVRARQDRLHGADLISAARQIAAAADEQNTIDIERESAVEYLCECILRLVERNWFLGCIETQRRVASEVLSLYLRRHFDRSRFSESLEEERVRERVEASEYLGACVNRMLDRCCYIESVMEDRDKAVAVEYLGLCILRMLDTMEYRAASAWRTDLELRGEAARHQEHDTEEVKMRAAQGGGQGDGAGERLAELAEHDVPGSGIAEYDAGADVARMRRFPTKNKYASPQRPAHQQRQRTAQEQVLLDIQLGRYRSVEAALGDGVVSIHPKYPPQGRTLLHSACAHGQTRIAKLLLRSAADINAEDLSGARPLQLARLHNFNDLADYLVSKGASTAVALLPAPIPRTPAPDPRPKPPPLVKPAYLA